MDENRGSSVDYREAYEKEHIKTADLAERVALLEAKNEELSFKLNRIKNNPLWKMSAPLRKGMHFAIRQRDRLKNCGNLRGVVATVGEFASRIKAPAGEVIKRLMLMGMMVTLNQTIDFDTAYLIADELGAEITKEVVVSIEDRLFDEEEDTPENLVERAPVVCVMAMPTVRWATGCTAGLQASNP